ncbi:hypothetical protein llap_322 [Limosa lapponica baueri]|uniref:Uncharacterized protein n=1 Tax=Limosa lapponica baueri TaxID=1758121 RepID=A0A2I0UTS0_LIMLA|nr:hypothetical protein llap_322 [Limosa lapponica baueri]
MAGEPEAEGNATVLSGSGLGMATGPSQGPGGQSVVERQVCGQPLWVKVQARLQQGGSVAQATGHGQEAEFKSSVLTKGGQVCSRAAAPMPFGGHQRSW